MTARQLAQAVTAARTFLSEAQPLYVSRPKPISDRLRCAHDVYQFVLDHRPTFPTEEAEVFLAVVLNGKHCCKAVVEVAKGTLASVDVHPRELFRELIVRAAAAAFVIHNHPSGDFEPSPDDLALTARLRDVGRLVGIPILDHLIVGAEGYVSLAERGLL